MAADKEAAAREAAASIVEAELGGPVAYVTGETVRLYTDEQGTVTLPMKPAANVTVVEYDSGQVQDLTTVAVDGQQVSGLRRTQWVRVTYDHGWKDVDVPAIVRTILDRVAARLMETPTDTVRAESIGSYRVDYDTDARWLTPDEILALSRKRRVVAGVTASPTTRAMGPTLQPAYFGDGSW